MTWIVGTLTPFGLGIVASDIRVTFTNRIEVDCLQKIYRVGGGLLAGFAGSVKIGFSLLQALDDESAKLPKDKAWNLDVISNTWWPHVARRIYLSADKIERGLSSQIILAGVHPNKNQGPFPQTDIYTFSAPDFQPIKTTDFANIGCGAHSPNCVKVVKDAFTKLSPEFLMLYQVGVMGLATGVGVTLQEAIRKKPIAGISPFFQVGVVSRGLCNFMQSEAYFNEDGTETKFPEVTRDYDSLIRLCEQNHWNTAAAVC